MKKKLLRIFIAAGTLCLLLSATAQAQANDPQVEKDHYPKFIIGITGGVTIPMGKFSQTDYCDVPAGSTGGLILIQVRDLPEPAGMGE